MKRSAVLAALLLTTACSSGGGDTSSAPTSTPAPSPTPTPTPTPTPSPTSTPTPAPTPTPAASTGSDNVAGAASLYISPPSAVNCVPGQLKPSVTAQLLTLINNIRALHRLPPVGYSTIDEPSTQQASLMMAANNALDHSPPASWRCYTAEGAAAAGSSNLYGGSQSGSITLQSDDTILAGWMDEIGNLVANNVGHRRWILNPFATTMSYGRTAVATGPSSIGDYAALKVFNTSGTAPASTISLPPFVAYPFGDYPARYFNRQSLLSFGVIADTSSQFANTNVSYSGATVAVSVHDGAQLGVSNVSSDTTGYGLPNNIQFTVAGLATNVAYDVTINNVSVNGTPKNYAYSFRIVP